MLGLETPFTLERPPDGPVDRRLGSQGVVVQIFVRSIDSIDTTMGLLPQLVRVGEAPEAHRVGGRAVPALSSCVLLARRDPFVRLGNCLMLVAVPFGVSIIGFRLLQGSQDGQFVIEVVEDDEAVDTLCQQLPHRSQA